jgi:hypothetical protein
MASDDYNLRELVVDGADDSDENKSASRMSDEIIEMSTCNPQTSTLA